MTELLQNLANAATFFALVLTGLTLLFNKKRIWRDKLTEKQLDHLLKLSDDLYKAAKDVFYVKSWADNIHKLNRELDAFKKEQPEEAKRQIEMSLFFSNIINQAALGNNVLYPETFDFKILQEYASFLKEYGSFSFYTFANLSNEKFNKLQAETLALVDKINMAIKKT
jgi:hypothetical protein